MKRENKIIKSDILFQVILPCIVVVFMLLVLSNVFNFNLIIPDNLTTDLLQLIFTVIIAFIGFYVYLNRNRDEELNYLELNLNITNEDTYIKIRTEVTNPTIFDREIYFAFLLISRTDDSFLEILNKKMQTNFTNTNSLFGLKNSLLRVSDDFAFLPLPYYYIENIQVGNEKLIYEVPLNNARNNEVMTFYDVRFFVYRKSSELKQYHRSVSCCFGIQGNLNLSHLKTHRTRQNPSKNIKK